MALPSFRTTAYSTPFKRDFKKLSEKIISDVIDAIKELESGQLTPGRQLKKRKPKNQGKWQVRLGKNHRMTFQIKNGRLTLRRVGTHRDIEKSD